MVCISRWPLKQVLTTSIANLFILTYFCAQVNYLIDETCNTGKGANSIISMLHHLVATHSFGKSNVHFHCDNCCGQRKNKYLMFYMMYRILACLQKQNNSVISTCRPLSPDWCFGLFKRHFKRSKVGCLDDIVKVVNQFSISQLVGSQNGEVIVSINDWSIYFEKKPIKTSSRGITQMYHFHFTASAPGFVKS